MDDRIYLEGAAPGRPDAAFEAIERLFLQLPAAERLHKGSRVLIKPNLLSRHPPEHAVTTHPDVLEGVIRALLERGVRDITVADTPVGTYTPEIMEGLYEACGIRPVCERLGAKLYTACESTTLAVPVAEGRMVKEFTVIRPVADCDFVISLPKMKTHVLTYLSGAVKNLFGCVPGLQKVEFHLQFPDKKRFGRMLVDLCEAVKPDIHLVDGIVGMEGDGPSGGQARDIGLLLAGENPYTVDLALCSLMGLAPMQAPMLEAATKAGLCPESLDTTLLVGEDTLKQAIPGYRAPESYDAGAGMNYMYSLPGILKPLMPTITRYAAPRPAISRHACIGCGRCAEICPQHVVKIKNKKAKIHYKGCIRCFCCHEICPVKAIDVKRHKLFGQ